MPQPPPDLQGAPEKWKTAFKALKDYAVSTSVAKVLVFKSDGSAAQVDLQPGDNGIVVTIKAS